MYINAGGDEKTIVQDAMEERVEEDHACKTGSRTGSCCCSTKGNNGGH